jgi:hypothetical protein
MTEHRIVARYLACDDRVAFFSGDGSERCLVCGWRASPSLYVGQAGRLTDEGLPERFPVCDEEHGLLWMKRVWLRALGEFGW